jgi:hypothetical protein
MGMNETGTKLRNKIGRGGFALGLFVQCLVVMAAHSVRLHGAD